MSTCCTHQELIDEIAIRTVDLNAVEARTLYCVARRSRIPLHVLLDLGNSERARDIVVTGKLDRGWRNVLVRRVVLLQFARHRRATECPELEVDEGALGVDGIRDLPIFHEYDHGAESLFARTSFHLLICSSLQIPGAWMYPPASGEMRVASEMRSVPGVLARCA